MFNEDHRLTLNLGFQVNSVTQEGNASLRYGYLYYRGEKFATVPTEITAANGLHKNSRDLHDEMRAGTTITTTKITRSVSILQPCMVIKNVIL